MLTYTTANSIFDCPIINLLSNLYILIKVLSGAHAKREKSLNDFKFGNSVGPFPSDGVASTEMKGLINVLSCLCLLLQSDGKQGVHGTLCQIHCRLLRLL